MIVETFEGNVQNVPFKIWNARLATPWDVSTASQIRLEVTRPDGTNMTPILCSSVAPGANWAEGLVVAPITASDVTATVGAYEFALTVYIAGEVITAAEGIINVKDRAGV